MESIHFCHGEMSMNGDTDLYLHYKYNVHVAVMTLLFHSLCVNFELFILLYH